MKFFNFILFKANSIFCSLGYYNFKYVLFSSNRNFGLDLVRCVAVLSVLFSHTLSFLIPIKFKPILVFGPIFGELGVELFFVLSGFLIGGILLKSVLLKNKLDISELLNFWRKRWIRTLPNYYLMLIVFYLINGSFYNILGHMVFLQEMIPPKLSIFPVSWSLCIEEWFYIVLPLFIAIFLLFTKNGNISFILTICLIVTLSIIVRYFVFERDLFSDYSRSRLTFLRLDSIIMGVLIMLLNTYFSDFLFKMKSHLFFTGCFIAIFLLLTHNFNLLKNNIIEGVLYYPLLSFSLALTIPYAIYLRSNVKYLVDIITTISIISYSIYLVHPIVCFYILKLSLMILFPIKFI